MISGVAYAIQLGEFYSIEYLVFRFELYENPKKMSESLKLGFYMGISLNFGLNISLPVNFGTKAPEHFCGMRIEVAVSEGKEWKKEIDVCSPP